MMSKGIEKTVTKVTKLHALIIKQLGVTFAVMNFIKVTKVTKVTEKLHAKTFCLSGFEGNM